ncbi:MAG: hypothetical protein AAGF12_08875 [Myxococcota bacterium]
MFRDDFLMRQIQQFAEAIAHSVGIAQAGNAEEATNELQGAYEEFLRTRGLRLEFTDSLEARTLLSVLGGEDHGETVAMFEEALAEVRQLAGHDDAASRHAARAKALRGLLSPNGD